ncbi:MAG: VWA domain-containing protein [Acidobacteriota bacterium]
MVLHPVPAMSLRLLLATTFLVASAATAQPAPPTDAEAPVFETVLPDTPQALQVDGGPCVDIVTRPVERWRVSLYFDPTLLTPSSMASSARALANRAGALATLGEVEVVLVDPVPTPYLNPTGDAAAIREALLDLADSSALAGELAEIRSELPERPLDEAARRLERELVAEEKDLLERSRDALLHHLATVDRAVPSALFRVRDEITFEDWAVAAENELAAIAAASGWTLLPLAMDRAPAPARPAASPPRDAAALSGGRSVRSPEDLDRALVALEGSQVVQCLPLQEMPVDSLAEVTDGDGNPLRLASSNTPMAIRETRARAVLEGTGDRGPLTVRGAVRLGPGGGGNEGPPLAEGVGAVTAVLDLASDNPDSARFLATLYLDRLDAAPLVVHRTFAADDLAGAARWRWRERLEVGDLRGGAVVIEDRAAGRWGAARLEFGGARLADGPGRTVDAISATSVSEDSTDTPPQAADERTPRQPPETNTAAPTVGRRVILLLPPRRAGLGRLAGGIEGAVTGKVRLETLVTTPAVMWVEFYLDGEKVAEDDRQPFSATVDLGREARPQTLRVVALDGGRGVLGEHTLDINQAAASFRFRLTRVAGEPAGSTLTVSADLDLPPDGVLERVEFYWNEELITTTGRTPQDFRLELPPEASDNASAADYLRLQAVLADGRTLEDVWLAASPGLTDRVEVNLVEIFAVVSDRGGKPVPDLSAEDFRVERKGETLAVSRFQIADEVPLVLGLLVDTSESMWVLMPDTKKAASRFLTETVAPGDGAFLVSFDDQPRLIHPYSQDVLDLIRGFGALRASGGTALWDSIVFSLGQIADAPGRRALVLLTDGQDFGSRFGPRRAVELARAQGVPVYILSLAGLASEQIGGRPRARPYGRADLETVTARTGGRLFDIDRFDQLTEAYAQINAELRNQYILGVSTNRPLSAEELADIKVEVQGLQVRAATGRGGS